MTVTAVRKHPQSRARLRWRPSSPPRRSGSGSCGPIRGSSSAGGDRRGTRRRSTCTTSERAAASSTTLARGSLGLTTYVADLRALRL
jgi:hypothetical protein